MKSKPSGVLNAGSAAATEQQRRMRRTLTCLVASMTAGALALEWMRPDRSEGAPAGVALMARNPSAARWANIRVDTCPEVQDCRTAKVHFLVDRSGNCFETSAGLTRHTTDTESTLRIGVVIPEGHGQITAVQESIARKLVRTLQEEYAIPGQRIVWAEGLIHPLPPRS